MYGKHHLFDGNDETCWQSDQGSTQFVAVKLSKPTKISMIRIQFQGGFVGRGTVEFSVSGDGRTDHQPGNSANSHKIPFEPADSNTLQSFPISSADCLHCVEADQISFLFDSFTDFYGRVIIYKMDILGPD